MRVSSNILTLTMCNILSLSFVGGAVASWLVRSSPDRVVRAPALARGHCVVFLGKTLNSHGASLHQVYKWVPVNCWGNLTNYRGVTCDGLASRLGGVEILLAASCCRDRVKLRQLWVSTGSKASLYVLNLKALGQSETWVKKAKISQRACVF